MMYNLFMPRRIPMKLEEVEAKEAAIQSTHKKNMQVLANARKTADNLRQVLETNHISIQIYKATGHDNASAISPRQ